MSNARDQGITTRDPPGRRRSAARSRATSIISQEPSISSDTGSGTPARETRPSGYGYGDQALAATASLGRTLFSSVSGATATVRGKSSSFPSSTNPNNSDGNDTARPSLLSRVSSSRPYPTTAIAISTSGLYNPISYSPSPPNTDGDPPPSVELASIVPDESRPPTVLLSRQNIGTFFQSHKHRQLQTASRFKSDDPPLTDRYGFICQSSPFFFWICLSPLIIYSN